MLLLLLLDGSTTPTFRHPARLRLRPKAVARGLMLTLCCFRGWLLRSFALGPSCSRRQLLR
jgi:hypothetical protein